MIHINLYSYIDLIQLSLKTGSFPTSLPSPFFIPPSWKPGPRNHVVSDSLRRRQKGTRCNWLQVASLASEPSVEGMHAAEHRLGDFSQKEVFASFFGVVG